LFDGCKLFYFFILYTLLKGKNHGERIKIIEVTCLRGGGGGGGGFAT